MKARQVAYWVSTALVAFMMFTGGVAALLHSQENMEGMRHLGYPDYSSYVLGSWKVLAALAIVAPKFPRLKEWAYAGIFFDLTGALASHAFSHDRPFDLAVPAVCTVFSMVSWALRPPTRRLGDVLPEGQKAKATAKV